MYKNILSGSQSVILNVTDSLESWNFFYIKIRFMVSLTSSP